MKHIACALAALSASPETSGRRRITEEDLREALQRASALYDKTGEQHYNLISAFIKSIRNSDADPTVYWLARMIEAGEDPMYIARRIVHHASEDIGLADPQALVIAMAAAQAAHLIGFPEAKVIGKGMSYARLMLSAYGVALVAKPTVAESVSEIIWTCVATEGAVAVWLLKLVLDDSHK